MKPHMRRALFLVLGLGLVMVAPQVQAQEKAPGTVILKGAPMGGVKFDHAAHLKSASGKCETCHHASKPQKAPTAKNQACTDCHTKTATPPMKTPAKLAFHDAMAKSGTCINCHKTAAKGPTKCPDCHKKENA